MPKQTLDQIYEKEIYAVYGDCNNIGKPHQRCLDFKSPKFFKKAQAKSILKKAVHGYNSFTYSCLDCLPEKAEISIAREGSVCLYIQNCKISRKMANKMSVDEFDWDAKRNCYRLWWD